MDRDEMGHALFGPITLEKREKARVYALDVLLPLITREGTMTRDQLRVPMGQSNLTPQEQDLALEALEKITKAS